MTRRISRRVWGTGIVVGIALVFLAGVIWWGMAASNKPQFQNQISMPSMAGTDTYLVNLWLDRSPAHVGTVTLTSQVASTIGTSSPIDSMVYRVAGPNGGTPVTVTTTRASGKSAPSDSFSAPVRFDATGDWKVTVEVHNGDVTRETTFTIPVR